MPEPISAAGSTTLDNERPVADRLTPNPDALYFMTFFNTKHGPIILDLPPGASDGSFNGNIVTVWQMPLEDAGLLGYDKGAGGNTCFCRPATAKRCPMAISHCSRTRSADMR